MGTTVVNGVVKQVPYGMVRNFRDAKLDRIEVVIFDSNNKLRSWSTESAVVRFVAGIPFYSGETVKVLYHKGSKGNTTICDIITVNPSTGAESVASSPAFTAGLQRSLVLACTAIDAGTGVATITTSYETY